MSIFREHKTIADRAASDRTRHREKIDKAIKESIRDVVAEESIIGQSGKKKIRIPVKGIKEHQFVYGQNENNKKLVLHPVKMCAKVKELDTEESHNKAEKKNQGISLARKCMRLKCLLKNWLLICLMILNYQNLKRKTSSLLPKKK